MNNDLESGRKPGPVNQKKPGFWGSSFIGRLFRKNQPPVAIEIEKPGLSESDKKRLELAEKIKANLERKGLLASEKESSLYYSRNYHVSDYSPPEVALRAPCAITDFDQDKQQAIIYLNPDLHLFSPYNQLMAIIEEAIHASQFRRDKGLIREKLSEYEIGARDKILKMAKFLGLSEQEIRYLEEKENYHPILQKRTE